MRFRFNNPLKTEFLPEHMTASRTAWRRWLALTTIFSVTITTILLLFTPLIAWMFNELITNGFSRTIIEGISSYSKGLLNGYLFTFHREFATTGPFAGLFSWFWYIGVALFSTVITMSPQLVNPHQRIAMKGGYANWCTEEDLERMEARRQVGITGGFLMALGRWPSGRRKGQMVQMIETLSALCLAPPGTGKTAGLVIPTLVTSDTVSFIVNDPKPELYEATAGYRERVSWVFMLDWSKVDKPEQGIFYPRFNFLSPRLVPPPGPDRDTYIDTVCKTLIPEPQKGGDSYFVNKGRAALTGFIHYLVAKIGDNGNYDGVPTEWSGMEPSLPLLTDFIATNQFEQTQSSAQDDGDGFGPPADKLGEWIRSLCDDVNANSPSARFPAPRAFKELSSLVNMADKERSGVLGTMDQAMLPFKNAAVAQRTSACDFTSEDMRGMANPFTNETRPVTLYICVNQAEAESFSTITALLYEVLSKDLLSYGPGEFNPKSNRVLGPHKVCFALDEFAKLPRIPKLIEGPDLGRSKGVSYKLVSQDFGQIEKTYSKEDISVIITTTAVKHNLPQNNPDTVERLTKMVGKTTILRSSKSYQEGLSRQSNPLAWSRQEQIEETNFLRNEDLAALEPGKVIVLVQGFLNRPMKLDLPLYFKDPELVTRVNYKGSGPLPTSYIPEFIRVHRETEYRAQKEKQDRINLAAFQKDEMDFAITPEEVATRH